MFDHVRLIRNAATPTVHGDQPIDCRAAYSIAANGDHADGVEADAIVTNTTTGRSALGESGFRLHGNGGLSSGNSQLENVRYFLAAAVIPSLCVVGIVGNLFSVVVFTRRRMKALVITNQNVMIRYWNIHRQYAWYLKGYAVICFNALVGIKFHIEQAGYEGLIALALSDSLCCITGLLLAASGGGNIRSVYSVEEQLTLYTKIYVPSMQNAFVRTSTWLTVLTAAGRYAAICRPMHARRLIGVVETRVSIVVIFGVSAALELPSLWTYNVINFQCDSVGTTDTVERNTMMLLDQGPFETNIMFRAVFSTAWTILGFVLPAVALLHCNIQLVRSLHESANLRRQVCRVANPRSRLPGNAYMAASASACAARCHRRRGQPTVDRLTPTLVAVIAAFLALVAPSEFVHHVGRHCGDFIRQNAESHAVALAIANLLQTINFAFNFILYCVVNVQFRNTCRYLLFGVLCRLRCRRQLSLERRSSTVFRQQRRLLFDLGAEVAAVGGPSALGTTAACSCRCSTTSRSQLGIGMETATTFYRRQKRNGGSGISAVRHSLTMSGCAARAFGGRRRSSAATVTAAMASGGGGCCDRRKLSSAAVVETAV